MMSSQRPTNSLAIHSFKLIIISFLGVIGSIALAYASYSLYITSGKFAILNAILALVWYAIIFFVYLNIHKSVNFTPVIQRPYFFIFMVAVGVRLLAAVLVIRGANHDIQGFVNAAQLLASGQDIYSNPNGWPYPPLAAYLIYPISPLAELLNLPFSLLVKIPFILADSLTSIVIFSVARRSFERDTAVAQSLAYALNPVAIFISSYHGQIDSIAICFFILSYWILARREAGKIQWMISGLLLAIAAGLKTWPLFYLPFFMQNANKPRYKFLYIFSFVVSLGMIIVPYFLIRPDANWRAIVDYRPAPGSWGYIGLLKLFDDLGILPAIPVTALANLLGPILILLGLGLYYLLNKTPSLAFKLTSITAIFLAASSSVAPQYLVWIVPLAILSNETAWLRIYSVLAIPILLVIDFGINIYGVVYHTVGHQESIYSLSSLAVAPLWVFVVLRALKGFAPTLLKRRLTHV